MQATAEQCMVFRDACHKLGKQFKSIPNIFQSLLSIQGINYSFKRIWLLSAVKMWSRSQDNYSNQNLIQLNLLSDKFEFFQDLSKTLLAKSGQSTPSPPPLPPGMEMSRGPCNPLIISGQETLLKIKTMIKM